MGYEFGSKDFPKRLAYTLFFAGCNLKCSFCQNPEVANANEGHYTLREISATVIEKRGRTIPELGVVFSGGEPTVSPYFNEAIDMFGWHPLAIHTNGLVLPAGRNRFEAVVLSIKPEASYEHLGRIGYPEKMLAAVDYYRTAKHKEIRIVKTKDYVQAMNVARAMMGAFNCYGMDNWKVNVAKENKRK